MAKRELSSTLRNLKVYAKSNLERGEERRRCQTIPYHLRFPFYEPDFGWGKPPWVTSGTEFKNLIVLMDTRDGDGIEVSLNLKEEDLAIFESTKELLEYASLNPTGANVPPPFNSFESTGLPYEIQRSNVEFLLTIEPFLSLFILQVLSFHKFQGVQTLLSNEMHGELYKALSAIYCKIMSVIPSLDTTQTGSKSGIQALRSLHVAHEKSKNVVSFIWQVFPQ
ncbi:hypothetical protein D8674_013493 [Pyrus ussuriensis x Pyrus communis]|uniref:BAHD acyltransferase n=1 Tax=Pyrus ussuriensis x Pyrus communis TaxID=2448454 RepID=A0A5N5H3F2_9ROSA|nr:hypothetical protein D8674_013493 [Pyrus ussuriensis x Pyrus communis]